MAIPHKEATALRKSSFALFVSLSADRQVCGKRYTGKRFVGRAADTGHEFMLSAAPSPQNTKF
ncbi:MAG: hypothetical protein ABI863_09930 [Ginsengibacter sp.]